MNNEQKERYIRWQEIRINQLSFSIDLFLGFSVASLAYVINIKIEGMSKVSLPIETTIICWGISAVLGCIAVVSKLVDYRYTARKIRNGGWLNTILSRHSGPITWGVFWGQIISYAAGAVVFITGILNA